MCLSRRISLLIYLAHLATLQGWSQAPGVPIEVQYSSSKASFDEQKILNEISHSNKALTVTTILPSLQSPQPISLALPPCHTEPLTPTQVWQTALQSRLRVGWYFDRTDGNGWEIHLSGAYAITAEGAVVTCYHVIQPHEIMRQGVLIASDLKGKFWPVTSVIACSRVMDCCILLVPGLTVPPLPLNDQTRPGDAAYLLSDPLFQPGYFSSGVVNRFHWKWRGPFEDLRYLWMNVSTDWAQGSSGAPVLDHCGNVICHVAAITNLGDGYRNDGSPEGAMTFHEGVPARAVKALVTDTEESLQAKPSLPRLRLMIDRKDWDHAHQLVALLEQSLADPTDKLQLLTCQFLIAVGEEKLPEALLRATELTAATPTQSPCPWNFGRILITHFPRAEPEQLASMETLCRKMIANSATQGFPASEETTLSLILFKQGKKEAAITAIQSALEHDIEINKPWLNKLLEQYRCDKLEADWEPVPLE